MTLLSKPILALDTASGASVCLLLADGSVDSASMHTPRAHSRELLPLLQALLTKHGLSWQDMGGFAVGVGPGSFTGLRVACATIAGINASLKKPVYSLCSLALTARQAETDGTVWAIEDARSKLVYAARYKCGETIEPARCMTWPDLLAYGPSCYITTSNLPIELKGWTALPLKLSREQALIGAVQAIKPNHKQVSWVEPVYLQPSQAEKNLT